MKGQRTGSGAGRTRRPLSLLLFPLCPLTPPSPLHFSSRNKQMSAEKRARNDEALPYVRMSNRQRLAQKKRVPKAGEHDDKRSGTAAAATTAATATTTKKPNDLSAFYRAWQWKREHLPDRLRFHTPYRYEWDNSDPAAAANAAAAPPPPPLPPPLSIDQRPFGPEGFASTVWDSSIVVAKMIEMRMAEYAGKACLDLSAGCGLPAAVLAALGSCKAVVATDLPANLPLLRRNMERAVECRREHGQQTPRSGPVVAVIPHTWGEDVAPLLAAAGLLDDGHHPRRAFDRVFLCDGMYISEPAVVRQLVASVAALVDRGTGEAVVSHGRNRGAEGAFLDEARLLGMRVDEVPARELHPDYVCNDVSVFRLTHGGGEAAGGGGGAERRERGGGGKEGGGGGGT